MQLALSFIKTRIGYGLVVLVLGVLLGFGAYKHFNPSMVTTQVITNTKTVTVEVPVLIERIINKIVKDPKDQALIAHLLEENKGLKLDVTALTFTLADLKFNGGGSVVTPPSVDTDPIREFKDFQLAAKFNSKTFNYNLTQHFKFVVVFGKDKDKNRLALFDLLQTTPNGDIHVPNSTTAIFADEAVARWRVNPRVQAGVARVSTGETGAVVAFQWLKHGKSTAAEDIAYAVGSPALYISPNGNELGLLPISFNSGRIPRNPLTNLWVSPYISRTKLGIVISATF